MELLCAAHTLKEATLSAGASKTKSATNRPLITPTIWTARPFENGMLVPVKFEAKSSFGVFRIHLIRAEMGNMLIEIGKD